MRHKAVLLLEDGFFLEGESFGKKGEAVGEVVFNTSMTGYQEILTDPSYKGQIVCLTYPLIGNYGINSEDTESKCVQAEGLIIKEPSALASNWRSQGRLEQYLKKQNKAAICNIDTRALTKHLREAGAMKGIISSREFSRKKLHSKLKKFPGINGRDLVQYVSCRQIYEVKDGPGLFFREKTKKESYTVGVVDCGVKRSILTHLKRRFRRVIVFPAGTSLKRILSFRLDGLVFSNGPGDPQAVSYVIALAKQVISLLKKRQLNLALMGICLGHQILAIALGAKAEKLRFGHHGGNHPVKELSSGRIDITAQNHNFIVWPQKIRDLELTHLNLYDQTPEGMRHKYLPIFSVQFHPEAGPGPFDAQYIFGRFAQEINKAKKKNYGKKKRP